MCAHSFSTLNKHTHIVWVLTWHSVCYGAQDTWLGFFLTQSNDFNKTPRLGNLNL